MQPDMGRCNGSYGHGPQNKTYDDFGVGVEIVVRLALTDNLVDVDIHSSIVAPIISQRDDQTDVVRFRGSNNVVLKDDVRDLAMQQNAERSDQSSRGQLDHS
jgi:hypothetical protein